MNSPSSSLYPSQEELSQLTTQAQRAMAVRCALRLLPLVKDEKVIDIEMFIYSMILFECSESFTNKDFQKSQEYFNNRYNIPLKGGVFFEDNLVFEVLNIGLFLDVEFNYDKLSIIFLRTAKALSSNLNNEEYASIIRYDYEVQKKIDSKTSLSYFKQPLWIISAHYIQDLVDDWEFNLKKNEQSYISNRYFRFFKGTLDQNFIDELEDLVKAWLNSGVAGDNQSLNSNEIASAKGNGYSDIDLLGRKKVISALADIIAFDKQDTPFTIGLFGEWGSGKSNLMHLLEKKLRGRSDSKRFYFANFNAWEYEHTDNMAAGVAQEVLKALLDQKSFREQLQIRLKFGRRENGLLVPLLMISLSLLSILSFVMFLIQDSQGWLAALVVTVLLLAGFVKQIFTILEHPLTAKINSYLKLPSYADHLGTIPILKRHLKTLCEIIIPKKKENADRLVVFVDDLDRCEPNAISRTLDAIRLVMDIENVVVIIGIDHRIAFRAVEKQYLELADDANTSADIAREYLGKIIQLPVRLEKPEQADLKTFISDSLFKGVKDVEIEDDIPGEDDNAERGTDKKTGSKDSGTETTSQNPEPGKRQKKERVIEEPLLQPSVPEDAGSQMNMLETVEEKAYFTELCGNFGLHNPRQLIRLRNCYRLLKCIYGPGREERKRYLFMLFWLEYLYNQRNDERTAIEKCLLVEDPIKFKKCLTTDEKKWIYRLLDKQFNIGKSNFENYRKYEQKVQRFVLPHSESPERVKEESERDAGNEGKETGKGDAE